MAKPKRITVVLSVVVSALLLVSFYGVMIYAEAIGSAEPLAEGDRERVPTIEDLAIVEPSLVAEATWSRTRFLIGRVELEYRLDAPEVFMLARLTSADSESGARREFIRAREANDTLDLFGRGPELRAREPGYAGADEADIFTVERDGEPVGAAALARRGRHVLELHVDGLVIPDELLHAILDRYLDRYLDRDLDALDDEGPRATAS
ncbi:MAG: hypothetical protein H6713_11540 [Myxococcales bacterium]|nr:hypothetical protein [Myxococcales bacterium]